MPKRRVEHPLRAARRSARRRGRRRRPRSRCRPARAKASMAAPPRRTETASERGRTKTLKRAGSRPPSPTCSDETKSKERPRSVRPRTQPSRFAGKPGSSSSSFLPAVVKAEDPRGVHRSHRVVDGDAVADPLRLHEELADPLEAKGLEDRAHVAARARPGEVGVHDRVAPEEVGEEHALKAALQISWRTPAPLRP